MGKYLVEVMGRYDGSYMYQKGKRWSLFPSYSVGWRISEERFFKNLFPAVNNLKFRWSDGFTGSPQGGAYAYINGYARSGSWVFSDGKTTTTEIGRYQLPATYQYKGIPRADKDAFLVADATDWQQLSLLEGEANVYFENSFVGKSILDPTQPSDTLHFSLGRDNGIRIQRTKVSEKSVRCLLASSQEQNMTWRILVKNTRKETVSLLLQDQIPVSRNSDISVTTEELSGGTLNKEQGIVSWQLQLQPGEQRELILQYKVKYPKSRKLIIE